MIDVKMQYQLIVFANISDVKPVPDTIAALIEMFRSRGFIPSTFQELPIAALAASELRLKLSSPDNEWGVRFGTKRIVVEKNPTDRRGSNLGEEGTFVRTALDIVQTFLGRYSRRASRVALITGYLLDEMAEPALANSYLGLFRPPAFYTENQPFEWNWRSVSRIPAPGIVAEGINVITSVNRLQGTFGPDPELVPFDRIQLSFDINTSGDNPEGRFEIADIGAISDRLLELHGQMLAAMLEHIHE